MNSAYALCRRKPVGPSAILWAIERPASELARFFFALLESPPCFSKPGLAHPPGIAVMPGNVVMYVRTSYDRH